MSIYRMAHSPDLPERYVCIECQIIHAGTVTTQTEANHQYDAPDTCGGCGATEFVTLENWPHFSR